MPFGQCANIGQRTRTALHVCERSRPARLSGWQQVNASFERHGEIAHQRFHHRRRAWCRLFDCRSVDGVWTRIVAGVVSGESDSEDQEEREEGVHDGYLPGARSMVWPDAFRNRTLPSP